LYLYPAGAKKHITYAYVRDDPKGGYQESLLRLPVDTGEYEVKWISSKKEELASAVISVVKAEAGFEAPSTAAMGTEVTIDVFGPDGMDGMLKLFKPGKKNHITYAYVRTAKQGGYDPVSMRMPATIGDYVIRWIAKSNDLVSEQPITVEAADIEIIAPQQPIVASQIEITLNAPDGLDGHIQLFVSGKKKHLTYAYVREANIGGYEPAVIVLPGRVGDYVLRWMTSKREQLAETPLSVVDAQISIEAQPSVPTSTRFDITIDAPAGIYGRVELVPAGKTKAITGARISEGKIDNYAPVKLKSPKQAGAYQLRLVSKYKDILAERDIVVE
jgi:Ca-activated chloride channel homolog